MTSTVVVDGASLTCTAVTAVARREVPVAVGERLTGRVSGGDLAAGRLVG